jgi:hypothetical protein
LTVYDPPSHKGSSLVHKGSSLGAIGRTLLSSMPEDKMGKSKVFIASSGRTLVLAEKLRDELTTDFSEPTLWSEEGRRQIGETIFEMLEGAAERFDFAVIILARDDMMTGGKGDTMKARDNCVFEAGLFMSAIGRKRCFLVNSVKQSDLPSDLGGIISVTFDEPADLTDRSACAQAIRGVAAQLKDSIQSKGPTLSHARVPLLTVDELFRRERPRSDGGDLIDGQVVVCDTQPWAEVGRMEQVRRNLDNGTSYHGFYAFSDDTIDKISLTLQMIAWAGAATAGSPQDFKSRVDTITKERDHVLAKLRDLCASGLLRVSLMSQDPTSCFRVHNAGNPALARYYMNYYNRGFVLWAEGQTAAALWRMLPTYLAEDKADRIFLPLKFPPLCDEEKQRLESVLTRSLSRYFPGMELDVKQICLGPNA